MQQLYIDEGVERALAKHREDHPEDQWSMNFTPREEK
jgi:hypothetical protein